MSFLAACFGASNARASVDRMLSLSGVRSEGRLRTLEGAAWALGAGRTLAGARYPNGADTRRDSESGLCLVWEGRLDDGQALSRTLRLPSGLDDCSLVIEAWKRWSTEAPRHLKGDFAFIVFDPAQQKLWAVRDALGVKPLYWIAHNAQLAFASEARVLSQAFGIGAPDESSVVRTLAGRPIEVSGTLYSGIRPVRAGSVIELRPGEVTGRSTCFWAPDPWRELDSHRAASRPAQLRELLKTAVARRSADRPRVAVTASGGLDSSAVAGVAVANSRELGTPCPVLVSVTYPGLACDESFFQAALARHLGAPHVSVQAPLDGYRPAAASDIDLFEVCVVPYGLMCREARARDLDVLLTGEGSDELQCTWGNELKDAVVRHDLVGALKFAGLFEAPLSPRRWRSVLGATARVALDWRQVPSMRGPDWLTPRAEGLLLAADEELRAEEQRFSHPSPVRQSICAELTLGTSMTYSLAWNQTFFARQGIELRHPFLDRDVAEFLLALPTNERTSFDLIKPTLRRAVERDLPPTITWRRTLSGYTDMQRRVFEAARTDWEPLTHDMALADLGLVDEPRFRSLLNDWGDTKWSRWDVQGTLEVESWLRTGHAVGF